MDDRLCIDCLVGKSQILYGTDKFDEEWFSEYAQIKPAGEQSFRGYRMDHLWKCAPLGMGPSQNLWAQYLCDGNVPAILKFTRVPMGFDH